MEEVGAVVIGAGVVGLAIARRLALSGREVIIVDAAQAIGTGTSSRNSEVIHAGLYYATGSLKAELCIRGRTALYAYCHARHVAYHRCGKLVVAANASEVEALEAIAAQAHRNGVDDVSMVSRAQMFDWEPAIVGHAALSSPSTGIIDSHALMTAYLHDAEAAGALLVLRTPFLRAEVAVSGLVVDLGGADPVRLKTRLLVNSAGLSAWEVSRQVQGIRIGSVPPRFLCKGSYFSLRGPAPARRLIYPVPSAAGLGVHLTLDLDGRARFGPDTSWVEECDYAVDPTRSAPFYSAIRRYWPALRDDALLPAYAGVRPKVVGPDEKAADFVIQGPDTTGAPGYVALYGMESPGLTASLAIADHVMDLVH